MSNKFSQSLQPTHKFSERLKNLDWIEIEFPNGTEVCIDPEGDEDLPNQE